MHFLAVLILVFAAAVVALRGGMTVEQLTDWLTVQAIPQLLSIAVLVGTIIGTWALFRLGTAFWNARRAKRLTRP
jgi:hypothetical protein